MIGHKIAAATAQTALSRPQYRLVAIAFLDVIGDRVLGMFAPSLVTPRMRMRDAPDDTPDVMRDLTRLIHRLVQKE